LGQGGYSDEVTLSIECVQKLILEMFLINKCVYLRFIQSWQLPIRLLDYPY